MPAELRPKGGYFLITLPCIRKQGRFGAEEAASALHVFVAETLQEGAPAFDLKTTVGSTHRG